MIRWVALMVLCLAAACSSLSAAIPVDYPILLGPVDRIKGSAEPTKPSQLAFEGEYTMWVYVCAVTAYPLISVGLPERSGMDHTAEAAFAELAGSHDLRTVTPRLDSLYVGAWVSFYVGCYGHKAWAGGKGTLQVTQ